jgi:hypothetical protein
MTQQRLEIRLGRASSAVKSSEAKLTALLLNGHGGPGNVFWRRLADPEAIRTSSQNPQ